jgi:hypothetical protein
MELTIVSVNINISILFAGLLRKRIFSAFFMPSKEQSWSTEAIIFTTFLGLRRDFEEHFVD